MTGKFLFLNTHGEFLKISRLHDFFYSLVMLFKVGLWIRHYLPHFLIYVVPHHIVIKENIFLHIYGKDLREVRFFFFKMEFFVSLICLRS